MIWVAPGLTDLALIDPAAGLVCTALDVGFPQARSVADDKPLADGTTDRTAFVGARAVTAQFVISAGTRTRDQNRAELAKRCHPGMRSEIRYGTGLLSASGADLRIQVRADQASAPVDNRFHTAVTVSLIGYTGLIEAATASTATVLPLEAAPGRSYNLVHNRVYPGPMPDQSTPVTYSGSMAAWPVVTITGPVTGPILANATTGHSLSFPGLAVGAGQTLVLDFAARTVLLDGAADRYSFLDFAASTWWQLVPGVNGIVLDGDAIDTGAQAVLSWRSTYLI